MKEIGIVVERGSNTDSFYRITLGLGLFSVRIELPITTKTETNLVMPQYGFRIYSKRLWIYLGGTELDNDGLYIDRTITRYLPFVNVNKHRQDLLRGVHSSNHYLARDSFKIV